MNSSKDRPVYFENLDALRGIAAILVVFYHIALWVPFPDLPFYDSLRYIMSLRKHGGPIAVWFFFVLSGFLITYLSIHEKELYASFSVKRFYLRRILRIWPLYFMIFFIGFIVFPYFMEVTGRSLIYIERANPLMHALFLANMDILYNGYPFNLILGVQWTVAVEEQFYLIWPLLFMLNKRVLVWVLMAIVLGSLLYSAYHFQDQETAYYHTFSCIGYITFGALLAYLSYYRLDLIERCFYRLNRFTTSCIYLSVLILVFYQGHIGKVIPHFFLIYKFLLMLFFGFVILEQNYSKHSFKKLGTIRVLTKLGKMSYGIYLTHMIAIMMVYFLFEATPGYIWLRMFLVLLFTFAMSYFSYRYFESYFLLFKKKFSFFEKKTNLVKGEL